MDDDAYQFLETGQNKNSDYNGVISYLMKKTDELSEELKSIKNGFGSVKTKQSDLKSENRELKRENKKLKIKIDDLKTELKDLDNFKKDSKFGQVSKLMEQIRDLQFLNEGLTREIKGWKAECNKLKKRIHDIYNGLDKALDIEKEK